VPTDVCEAPEIAPELIDNFKRRLAGNNYELVKNKGDVVEYQHTSSNQWSLQVRISKNEIAFTCPPKESFMFTLLYEALRTAVELCDHDELAIYHCNGRGWINNERLSA